MKIYTYSEARQKLASALNAAETGERVLIRRKDGRTYAVVAEKPSESPLEVPTVKSTVTTRQLVAILKKERSTRPRSR